MSRITGTEFDEAFKMRVVSGMLVDGSIQVTWATGEKATSQMDWGLDPENLATTPEYHSEPAEMVRYHTLYFPITYLDARHYFRVRSKTAAGKLGQSRVYSVITPDDVQRSNEGPFGVVELELTPIADKAHQTALTLTTTAQPRHQPDAASQPIDQLTNSVGNITTQSGGETGNVATNPITTIT